MSANRLAQRQRLRQGLDWLEFDLRVTHVPRHAEFPVSSWTVTADLDDFDEDGESAAETIFWMDGWLFPVLPLGTRMFDALDATAADAEVFAPLTDSTGRLAEKYQPGFGSHLVITNHAKLAPEWRGMGGLGRYLAGSAFLLLSDFATCIALHPSPFELREKREDDVPDHEWEAGIRKLTELWMSLGAEPAPGGNLVIDPTLIHLQNAVDQLYKNLSASA
ncbi:hypothetical protein L1785_18850 [Antribacter sp. KLBMP9083]|uniref:Uncharacterized protein n=1 Tax=Antribacter soli TaxID=2910976 RepID=A0AA41QJ30_9MICO|nr:hypothetical protein [Antribacter soli]MCF4123039.1 hypothetical protein [Antribacter soli]